jgi:hypothetical protein
VPTAEWHNIWYRTVAAKPESQLLPTVSDSKSDAKTTVLIKSHKDVEKQVQQVRLTAERSVQGLRMLLANEPEALQVLRFIKFKDIGHHPADDLKINILDQAQLTFNYLAKFEATRWLLTRHPELLVKGLELNVSGQSGFDIESVEADFLAAEVFSSTHPKLNNKLGQVIRHLAQYAAGVAHRYVFFSSPGFSYGRCEELETTRGIEVWSFPPDLLLKSAQSGTTSHDKSVK